jgi:hypothetical protein
MTKYNEKRDTLKEDNVISLERIFDIRRRKVNGKSPIGERASVE